MNDNKKTFAVEFFNAFKANKMDNSIQSFKPVSNFNDCGEQVLVCNNN